MFRGDSPSVHLTVDHRTSCHRCGNIRKSLHECTECPQVFCNRCTEKMMTEHGLGVFKGGCPVCKDLCCCGLNKSLGCTRQFHCYKKCPTTRPGGVNFGICTPSPSSGMKFVRNQNRRAFSRNEGASADSMGHYGGSHTLSSPISIVSQHHQLGQRQGQSQGLSMLQTDMHTQSNSPTGLHYGSESEEIGDTNGFRESHGSAEDIEQFFISGDDWVKTQFNGNPRHYDHQNGVDPDYIYGSGSSTTDSNSCIVFVDRTVKDMFPFLSTPTPTSPFNAPQHSLSPPASPNAVIDMMSTMERTERTSSLPLPSAQSNFYYNARAMGDNLNGNQFVQPSVDDPRGRTPSPDQHLYSQGQTNFDNVNNLMQRTNVGMATRRSDLSYKSSSIDNQLERYISAARSERQGPETLTTNEGVSVTENEKIPTKIHQINKNKPKQQNHYNHQLQLQSEKDQITKLNGKGGKSKKARGSPFTSLNNNSSISSQIDSNLAPLEGFLSSNYFIKDGLTEQSGPFFLQQSLHCYPKALSLKELVGGVVPPGQGIGVDTGIGIGIGIGTGVGAGSGAGAGQSAPSKKRYRKHPASISMNKSRQENNSMCVLSSDSQDSSDQVYGSEFQNGKAQLFQQQQLQQQQQQQKEYQDRQQQLNDEGNTRFLRHDDKYHYDSGSFADSSCPQLNSQSQSKLSLEESKLASIMSSLSSETGNMLYGNRLDNNTSHEPKQMARRTRSATNNTNISVTDVDDDGVPGPHDRMRTQSENKYKEMDRARKCADYEYHNHIEVNMPEETEKEGDIEGEVERHQTQRQQQRTSMIDDLACTDIKVKYPADRESEREDIGASPTRLDYKEREIIDYSDSSRQYVHLFDPFQRFDDFYAIGPSSSSSNSVNSLSINTTKHSFFTNPPWGCDYFGTDDRQKCTIGTRIGNGENASIEIARDDQLDQNVRPNSSMNIVHSDVDVDVDAEADELLMSTFGEHIRDYSDIPMTFPRTHILPVVYQPETDIPKTSTQDEGISDIFMTQMSHNSAMENNSCNDNNADNSSNNNNNNNDESYQDSKSAYKISVGSNLSSPSNSRKASLIYPKSKIDEEKIISKIDSWNIPGPRSMAFPPRVPTITSAYALSSGELSNAQHSSPPVCYVEAVDSGNRVDTLGCSIPILRDKSHLGEASTDIARTGLLSLVPARKDDHYPQSNIVGNEYSDNMMRIGHDVSPSPSSPPFTSPLLTPTTEALLCVMNASISQIKSNNNNIRNIDKHNGQNYNMNNNENAESRHQYENKETVNRCDTIFTNLTHPETPPTSDSISVSFSPFLTFTPDRDTTLPGISSRSDTGFPLGSTIQQNLEINRGRNRNSNRDVEKNEWWGE